MRQGDARNPVGEQEVQVLMGTYFLKELSNSHHFFILASYKGVFEKEVTNMDGFETLLVVGTWGLAALVGINLLMKVTQRLQLSLAKHPSLGGHLRMAKRVAKWIPGYNYGPERWFDIDGAPASVAMQRRHALQNLGAQLQSRSPQTLAQTEATKPMVSDLQLISQYRVPFQFRSVLAQHIKTGSFWRESQGVWLTDLDGNQFIDVTGSYGVNLFGMDFYKSCIQEGADMASKLGPVLGSYHPCVLDNVQQLCAISGQDEVSFHMSGTEAVMQAVRLARYHSKKRKIVRFTGAYHGWWDDVQPGPGNPMPPSSDTLTLNEMHPNTLRVLRNRSDIACVLVNPLQAMHVNKAAPTDSTLVDGGRQVHYDKAAYKAWLAQLREVCTDKGIALILDEVFLGFRLAPGGAQEYFDVRADMVTYGKTLGGGLPVGVVCGKTPWMKRFSDDKPGDICFARGTFNAHPYVMATMNVFLHRLQTPAVKAQYKQASVVWQSRQDRLNAALQTAQLPVHVAGMETVWSVLFDVPSRYNWMFQYYLREQGIALSWVGSGRMIFNFEFDDTTFELFTQRFIKAAQRMQEDGWWWTPEHQNNRNIRRQVLKEMLRLRWA
jgi:glutamate-1-semialdehyde 2,1-aminomutase